MSNLAKKKKKLFDSGKRIVGKQKEKLIQFVFIFVEKKRTIKWFEELHKFV